MPNSIHACDIATNVSSQYFTNRWPMIILPFCWAETFFRKLEDYIPKSQQCKFLPCNSSSSFYSHCCNYRALLHLILILHPLFPAQPGTLLSGSRSANSTQSVKERTRTPQLCTAHREKQKALHQKT